MKTTTNIESFTDEEQDLIAEAIECQRGARAYSDKPRFYHDMILIGCHAIVDMTRKPSEKA